MPNKKLIVAIAACAAFAACQAFAGNVFLLPGTSGTTATVAVYSGDPIVATKTFEAASTSYKVIANAAGTRYFLIGNAATDTLLVADASFNITQHINLGQAATAAALTPDGSRLLVTADRLRIFDASAGDLTEIEPKLQPDVGTNPVDVVVSHNSSTAWVLSALSRKLTAVSLTTYSVLGSLTIPGSSSGIALAPNGKLWIGSDYRLYEVDGETMAFVGDGIRLNSRPGRLAITPDGSHAIAINAIPVTGITVELFDLENKIREDYWPKSITFDDVIENVAVVSNSKAYAMSSSTGRLFVISLDTLNVEEASYIANYGTYTFTGVKAIAASDELPDAKYLYVATDSEIRQINLSTNKSAAVIEQSGGYSAASFAGAPSASSPASVLKFGDNQSVDAGGTTSPLVIRVLDATGRPLTGVPVTYSTTTSGATFTGVMSQTGVGGYAEATLIAPGVDGTVTVNVAIGSTGALSTTFTVGVGTSTSGSTSGIEIVTGNGMVLYEYRLSTDELTVKITDSEGNVVSGRDVTFSITDGVGTLTAGSYGTVSGETSGQSVKMTTKDDGLASVKFISGDVSDSYSYAQTTVAASHEGGSVNFTVTTAISTWPGTGITAGLPLVELISPTDRNITARAGETLAGAIKMRVSIQSGPQMGKLLPGVGMTASTGLAESEGPTASCSPLIPLSDEEGIVTCDLKIGPKLGTATLTPVIGGYQEMPYGGYILTVLQGGPSTIAIIQGNNQSGNPGTTLPKSLIAEVRDAGGNIISGATVTWEVLSGSVTLSNATTTSDSNGRVSATATLGTTGGAAKVRVSSGSVSAVFDLTVNISATQMTKISGDNQTTVVGAAFGKALVVELRNANSEVVSGVNVSFVVTSGPATLSAASAVTDEDGRASVTATAGTTTGAVVVTASAGSLTATFQLAVSNEGPAVKLTGIRSAISGDLGVTPGGLTAIYGDGIADNIEGSVTGSTTLIGQLPTKLANVQVWFGETAAPIYTVNNSNGQQWAVVQAPFSLTAPGKVTVTISVNGNSTVIDDVEVKSYQPGIFETADSEGNNYAILINEDGSYVTRDSGAKRGTNIRMFASGLGQTSPELETNHSGIDDQKVLADVVIGVNNAGVPVVSAETMVGAVGIYIVTFELPADTETGTSRPFAIAIRPTDGGSLVFGNPSTIPVQ